MAVTNDTVRTTFEAKDNMSGPLGTINNSAKNTVKGFESIQGKIVSLQAGFQLAAGAIRGITNAIQGSVSAFAEQERVEIKLANALKLTNQFTQESLNDFRSYASALQNISTVGDETTLELASQAIQLGRTKEQTKELIAASIELAAVTGKDVKSSFDQLSQSYTGIASRSLQLQKGVKSLTAEQLKNGDAVKLINENLKGTAQANLASVANQAKQASNAFGDLLETVGGVAVKLLSISTGTGSIKNFIQSIDIAIKKLEPLFSFIGGILSTAGEAVATATAFAIAGVTQIIARFQQAGSVITGFLSKIGLASKETSDALAQSSKENLEAAFESNKVALEGLAAVLDTSDFNVKIFEDTASKVASSLKSSSESSSKVATNLKEIEEAQKNSKKLEEDMKKAAEAAEKINKELLSALTGENFSLSKELALFDLTGSDLLRAELNFQLSAIDERIEKEGMLNDSIKEQLKFQRELTEELGNKRIQALEQSSVESISTSSNAQSSPEKSSDTIGVFNSVIEALKNIGDIFANLPSILNSFLDNFDANFDKFISSFGSALTNFVEKIPDIINKILEALPDLIIKISEAIVSLIEKLPEILDDVLKRLPDIIKALFLAFGDIVVAIIDAIPSIIETIADNMDVIVEALVIGILNAIPKIVIALIKFIIIGIPRIVIALAKGFINAIAGFFKGLFSGGGIQIETPAEIKELPKKLAKTFKSVAKSTEQLFSVKNLTDGTSVEAAVKNPVDAIGEATKAAIASVASFFEQLLDFVTEAWRRFFDGISQFVEELGQFITEAWRWFFNKISDFVSVVGQFLKDAWIWLFSNAAEIIMALGNFIRDAWLFAFDKVLGPLIGFVQKAFEGAFKFLGEALKAILNPIRDILAPIFNLFSQAVTKLANFFRPAIDIFKRAIDLIATPFRVLASALNSVAGVFRSLADALSGFSFGGGGSGGGIISRNVGGTLGSIASSIGLQSGGEVPKKPIYAQNGAFFKPIGTDTIPAMLSPGEFVVSKPAVDNIGVSALKAINNGVSQTGGNFSFNVTINASTKLDADSIRSEVVPQMIEAIRRKSQDGEFVIDARGVRNG